MNTGHLRIVALTAAAALTLAACGNSGGATDRAEITMWMYPVISDPEVSAAFWTQAESDFEAAHPDVDLTIELQTFDKRDAQISAALAAGTGPDIVLITPDQAATYVAVGGLLPVDAAVEADRDAFFSSSLEAATLGGDLYGVPIFQNVNTTMYNAAAFTAAGLELPRTWDDIRQAAPVLASEGIAVMDYAGSPEQTLNLSFYPFLWQAGGHVFSDDGTDIAFDSPQGLAALQFLMDLNEAGALPPDAITAGPEVEGTPLALGDVGMRVTADLKSYSQLQAALGADAVALGAPLTGVEQVTYGNPGLLSLTSINDDSNREAAYEVLSYFSSADFQASLLPETSAFATRTDVEFTDTRPGAEEMTAALPFAYAGEPSPAARQVMAALAPRIQAALTGDMTAEEALDAAAAEAREVLANSQP